MLAFLDLALRALHLPALLNGALLLAMLAALTRALHLDGFMTPATRCSAASTASAALPSCAILTSARSPWSAWSACCWSSWRRLPRCRASTGRASWSCSPASHARRWCWRWSGSVRAARGARHAVRERRWPAPAGRPAARGRGSSRLDRAAGTGACGDGRGGRVGRRRLGARLLGGVTGDIFGAVNEVAEVAVLGLAVVVLAG